MFAARYTTHARAPYNIIMHIIFSVIMETNGRYRRTVLTDDENHVVRPPAQVFPDRLTVVRRGGGGVRAPAGAAAAGESDGRALLQLHLRSLHRRVIVIAHLARGAVLYNNDDNVFINYYFGGHRHGNARRTVSRRINRRTARGLSTRR